MADPVTTFVSKLQSSYDLPHGLSADAKQQRIADITRRVSRAVEEDSRVAPQLLEVFPEHYKRRTLPTVRDVIEAIDVVKQQLAEMDAKAKAQTRQARQENERQEYTSRAEAAIRQPLGRRAVEEGWINGLYDFVERHGREPGALEISEIQRKSRELAQALESAVSAPGIPSVRRAVLARKERLTRIALEQQEEELGL